MISHHEIRIGESVVVAYPDDHPNSDWNGKRALVIDTCDWVVDGDTARVCATFIARHRDGDAAFVRLYLPVRRHTQRERLLAEAQNSHIEIKEGEILP